jgi:hypothetical protein
VAIAECGTDVSPEGTTKRNVGSGAEDDISYSINISVDGIILSGWSSVLAGLRAWRRLVSTDADRRWGNRRPPIGRSSGVERGFDHFAVVRG